MQEDKHVLLGNYEVDTKSVRSDDLSSWTFKSLVGPTHYNITAIT